MRLDEFRQKHSELIENYQFIEMHLEAIYAALSKMSFYEGLKAVERSNLHELLNRINKLELKTQMVLTDGEKDALSLMIKRRNFWTHSCYTDLLFKLNGDLKRESDAKRLIVDLYESAQMRKLLYERFMQIKDLANI
jgi:hypothetical protein